jgi:hypothetical protein
MVLGLTCLVTLTLQPRHLAAAAAAAVQQLISMAIRAALPQQHMMSKDIEVNETQAAASD